MFYTIAGFVRAAKSLPQKTGRGFGPAEKMRLWREAPTVPSERDPETTGSRQRKGHHRRTENGQSQPEQRHLEAKGEVKISDIFKLVAIEYR